MKKQYQKPEIEVVVMNAEPMMAASVPGPNLEDGYATSEDETLSKEHNGRFDIWGLDE